MNDIEELYQARFRQTAFFENDKSEQNDENSRSRWELMFQLTTLNLWSIFLATTVALPQRQETQARQRCMQKRTSAVAALVPMHNNAAL